MDKKLFKDIVLICKGWYDSKYNSVFEALEAYYHKEYGINFNFNKKTAIHLFLEPATLEIVKRNPSMAIYIFKPSFFENDYKDIEEIEFYRLLNLIVNTKSNILNDLPSLEELKEKLYDTNII